MKGINQEHADKIKTATLIQQYNECKSHDVIINRFDKNGEVIRDHKKELEIVSQDETTNMLTHIGMEHFDSFRKYRKLLKQRKDSIPIVDIIPLAPLPKSNTKSNTELLTEILYAYTILPLKKLTRSLNSLF